MRKIRRILTIVCVIFALAGCVPLSSCAIYLDLFEEEYSEWYSESGVCGFIATEANHEAYGYFKVNGKTVRALFNTSFDASVFITFPYSDDLNIATESSDGFAYDTSYGECYGRIDGYREGEVFHVTNMRAGHTSLGSFDLFRRKVNPSTVDARDFAACVWRAEDGSFTIKYDRYGFDEYIAAVITDGETQSVYFKWLDGRRFEIGDKPLSENGRNVLASGSYTNDALALSLIFETDTAFGQAGKTVGLAGEIV